MSECGVRNEECGVMRFFASLRMTEKGAQNDGKSCVVVMLL